MKFASYFIIIFTFLFGVATASITKYHILTKCDKHGFVILFDEVYSCTKQKSDSIIKPTKSVYSKPLV